MKEFVDNNYGRRKAEFFRDQVVSNAKAAMIKTRDEAISNPEIFADTPMAWNGTQVYNGMKSGDILAMYDKKQNAYDSINPFESLATNFSETTKYFTDPRYFSHRQTAYINPKFMDGLGEDDIANAFIRKGINSDMARGLSYDYFNPQQTTDTTDYTTMSREDKKAMRKSERNEYKKMLNNQKDWFSGAFNLGAINPSYACGGIKKMAPGGTYYKAQNNGYIFYYDPVTRNYYYDDGKIYNNGEEVGDYNVKDYSFDFTTEPTDEEISNYDKIYRDNYYRASNKPATDVEVINNQNEKTKSSSSDTTLSNDKKTPSNGVTPPAAKNDTYGRSFINISTPWGTGRVFVDNNNIDVRRNGRRLAIWGRQPGEYVAPATSNGYHRMDVRYPQQIQTTPYEPSFNYTPKDVKITDPFNRPNPTAPISGVQALPLPSYEPQISFPKITRKDVVAPNNFYYGDKALLREEINELNSAINSGNPDRFMRCGGVTKAALGMALIDDEKYDNGNMPNTPIGPVNPVSWEPMMTVDTTPSKEESTPQGSGMDSIADQADAATGIKNKNDYGYGISNAAWNGLMFAGNFAEKMRNDKNQLASVAARLNNTQDAQVAMRGYAPTVNPTHLGYDADPSRLSQLYTAKYGGRKYALGGVYDLTAKEIDEILNNGGKIEYLW